MTFSMLAAQQPVQAFQVGYILSASVAVPVRPGGMPGNHSLTVQWGEREPGLEGLDFFVLPADTAAPSVPGEERYTIRYAFHQQLVRWGGDGSGWGVWGRAAISDNELSAIGWSVSGGIGGDSPLPDREGDRWGLGAFHYQYSDFLADQPVVDLGSESGVEFFYTARLRPWFHLSGDIQYVDPPLAGHSGFFAFALRASLRF